MNHEAIEKEVESRARMEACEADRERKGGGGSSTRHACGNQHGLPAVAPNNIEQPYLESLI